MSSCTHQYSVEKLLDEIEQNLGDEIPSWVIQERRSNISSRIQMLNDQMNGLTVCPLETDTLGGGAMEACWECIEEACETELDACIIEQNCFCWLECEDEDNEDECNTICGEAGTEWKALEGCFEKSAGTGGTCEDDCK